MLHNSRSESPPLSTTFPPLRRLTITEEVLGRVRDLILRGVLRPGARVDQAELATSFGVSTVPVREALLRLQSVGLVENIPHRGVFVSQVSVEELLDIYTTRELLEEQAARLSVQHLSASGIAALESIATSMQSAASKQQLDELLALNRELHFTIYRAAKRRHLLQLIEQLWDLSTRYAHLQLHAVPDRAAEALYEIRSIVAACKRKDVDALGWMIRYKVHQTTAGLLQHMTSLDPGQTQESTKKSGARPVAAGKTTSKKAASSTTSGDKSASKSAGAKKNATPRSAVAKKAATSGATKTPKKSSAGAAKKSTEKAPKKSTSQAAARDKSRSGKAKGSRGA